VRSFGSNTRNASGLIEKPSSAQKRVLQTLQRKQAERADDPGHHERREAEWPAGQESMSLEEIVASESDPLMASAMRDRLDDIIVSEGDSPVVMPDQLEPGWVVQINNAEYDVEHDRIVIGRAD
jgi:hypothetical protein